MCVMLSKFTKTNFKPKKNPNRRKRGGGCAGPESAFIYDIFSSDGSSAGENIILAKGNSERIVVIQNDHQLFQSCQ